MSESCSACGAAYREGDAFCAKCGTARTDDPASASAATIGEAEESAGGSAPKHGAIAVAGVFLLVPFLLMLVLSDCGDVEGSVEVRGGPHGDFTFVPTSCDSMQPFGRMGANVHASGHNDGAVYVSGDPVNGAAVDIEVPGSCRNADGTDCTVFHVPRERCTVWEARVTPTGVLVNEVRLVEGGVRLDCTLDDGTSVKGSLTFGGC